MWLSRPTMAPSRSPSTSSSCPICPWLSIFQLLGLSSSPRTYQSFFPASGPLHLLFLLSGMLFLLSGIFFSSLYICPSPNSYFFFLSHSWKLGLQKSSSFFKMLLRASSELTQVKCLSQGLIIQLMLHMHLKCLNLKSQCYSCPQSPPFFLLQVLDLKL